MNILFYQHQYPAFGGIETVTTTLANAFAEDGHQVAIVSLIHKDGTDLLDRLHPNVVWRELPEKNRDSESNCRALGHLLDEFSPDYILFQDSYANIQGILFRAVAEWRARKGRGQKVSSGICAAEHSMPRLSPGRRRIPLSPIEIAKRFVLLVLRPYLLWSRFRYESCRRKEIFDHVDAYVILSKNYRRRILELVGTKRLSKLHVIPNMIDAESGDLSLLNKKKQILFVGSLIGTKGVDRLLDAWRELCERYMDWEFVIVGDGDERPSLECIVSQRRIRGVRFEGFHREVSDYYRDASIFVMASDFEGWPMVVGESMRQGCVPVVYDSFAAASDMIDDGVNGRVVRHFAKRAFVSALKELMDNCQLRHQMARAAHGKSKLYSIDNVKKMWYKLFNLMGGGGYNSR